MTKIIKPLDGKSSTAEIEGGTHLSTVVRWEDLAPHIASAIRKTDNEKIIGIIADDHGITVRLGHED
jgi:hypothetical protein